MLQRLAQFCVALLDFFEQPHVLDGDDGLIGEGFEQVDLLFGERPDLGAANDDCPIGDRPRAAAARRARFDARRR